MNRLAGEHFGLDLAVQKKGELYRVRAIEKGARWLRDTYSLGCDTEVVPALAKDIVCRAFTDGLTFLAAF